MWKTDKNYPYFALGAIDVSTPDLQVYVCVYVFSLCVILQFLLKADVKFYPKAEIW